MDLNGLVRLLEALIDNYLENAEIPTITHLLKPYKDEGKTRVQYDLDLVTMIKRHISCGIDLIVLAGFMHILSADFINCFPQNTIINLHPALPGCFDGARAIERAYEAFEKKEIKQTGVMVHWYEGSASLSNLIYL